MIIINPYGRKQYQETNMSKTECSDHKNGISFSISNRFVVPRYFASQVRFIG